MKPDPLPRVSGPATPPEPSGWRLERKIPVTLVLAALAQLVALVAWATWLEARVTAMETGAHDLRGLSASFARLEERIEGVRQEISLLRREVERKK